MEANRPIVISIAGFDPSGGAGLLADIKTFEQHKVHGLGISTAQTLQTEDEFIGIRWENQKDILLSLETMLSRYPVKAVKIGIVENMGILEKIVSMVHSKKNAIKIVWDTVIKSTSGFNFWNKEVDDEQLYQTLKMVDVITPNYNEAVQLVSNISDAKQAAKKLSAYCNVLLKGGHNIAERGVDYLYTKNHVERLEGNKDVVFAKHGSGCVLSAAIAANLALDKHLPTACKNAKQYIEQFLSSNETLLGYHHV